MAIIEMKNLWKEYGDQVVLERLNATVREGEFVTVVGASGCGKTTFLKMLLGTESPSRGELLLDGKPLPSEPDESRGIVFQRYSVLNHLTALENVMLGGELQASRWLGISMGKKRKQLRQAALQMLESVGLDHAADKYPHELSGGMQQRLALAQALDELDAEGGVAGRSQRYRQNCDLLTRGMREMGFQTLLPDAIQAPIIVTFHMPADPNFYFDRFYDALRHEGYVIYPGKLTVADSFRIGCIGRIDVEQINGALAAVRTTLDKMGVSNCGPA